MQIDAFVLFVLQILSQDHRHFGNSIGKDEYAIESTRYKGGIKRFDREREKRDEFWREYLRKVPTTPTFGASLSG